MKRVTWKGLLTAATLAVAMIALSVGTTIVTTQSLVPSITSSQLIGCFVRGFLPFNVTTDFTNVPLVCNGRGDQSIAQGVPERTELVRMGRSWDVSIPTASAIAPVAAWPTTACALELYNGETGAGGLIYVIDRLWLAQITSTTAAQINGPIIQVVPNAPPLTAPTNNTALLFNSLSGNRTNYNGRALVALATTIATASKWQPVGNWIYNGSTTNLMSSMEAQLSGRYLVPPGAAFCMDVVGNAATGTFIGGIDFHEVALTLGL